MTTLTEIGELRVDMVAKFERAYGELVELKSDQHGMAQDIATMKMDIADLKIVTRENAIEIAKVNEQLSRLESATSNILAILKGQPPGVS